MPSTPTFERTLSAEHSAPDLKPMADRCTSPPTDQPGGGVFFKERCGDCKLRHESRHFCRVLSKHVAPDWSAEPTGAYGVAPFGKVEGGPPSEIAMASCLDAMESFDAMEIVSGSPTKPKASPGFFIADPPAAVQQLAHTFEGPKDGAAGMDEVANKMAIALAGSVVDAFAAVSACVSEGVEGVEDASATVVAAFSPAVPAKYASDVCEEMQTVCVHPTTTTTATTTTTTATTTTTYYYYY
jgi:hypothetical protein